MGAPEWLSQLDVRLLISAPVTIPGLWDRAPVGLLTEWEGQLKSLTPQPLTPA